MQQLVGRFGIQGARVAYLVHQVRADVIRDDFSHQPRDRSTHAGDCVEHLFAAGFAFEGALNRINLAPNPTHSR